MAVLAPSFEPVIPWGQEYLWQWFLELQQGRQEGFSGPSPMSWQDMAQWAALTNSRPRKEEWRILRAMDIAFIDACADKSAKSHAPGAALQSDRPLTPELFDALFQ